MSTTSDPDPTDASARPTQPAPRSGAAHEADQAPGSATTGRSRTHLRSTSHAEELTGVRASDAEREEVVADLHRALGEGRLDLEETEHRVAAAYATTYRDELPALLLDLPATDDRDAQDGPTGWPGIWLSLVWRARIAVWGDGAAARPTAAQQRTAVLVVGLAMLWTVFCAVVAAIAVAS